MALVALLAVVTRVPRMSILAGVPLVAVMTLVAWRRGAGVCPAAGGRRALVSAAWRRAADRGSLGGRGSGAEERANGDG